MKKSFRSFQKCFLSPFMFHRRQKVWNDIRVSKSWQNVNFWLNWVLPQKTQSITSKQMLRWRFTHSQHFPLNEQMSIKSFLMKALNPNKPAGCAFCSRNETTPVNTNLHTLTDLSFSLVLLYIKSCLNIQYIWLLSEAEVFKSIWGAYSMAIDTSDKNKTLHYVSIIYRRRW